MCKIARFLFAASLSMLSGTAIAAEPTSMPGTVHRLSPDEVQAVQETAERRNVGAQQIDDRSVPDGRIHGEIGFGIGTGGYNSVFGTAIVPLSDHGIAAFSFERTNFGRRRYRY